MQNSTEKFPVSSFCERRISKDCHSPFIALGISIPNGDLELKISRFIALLRLIVRHKKAVLSKKNKYIFYHKATKEHEFTRIRLEGNTFISKENPVFHRAICFCNAVISKVFVCSFEMKS